MVNASFPTIAITPSGPGAASTTPRPTAWPSIKPSKPKSSPSSAASRTAAANNSVSTACGLGIWRWTRSDVRRSSHSSASSGLVEGYAGNLRPACIPRWRADFRQMRELGLLDLANRKGKAPGGYQSTLPECRLPFIFMNAVGLQRDLETMLHEAGHAFHALAAREEDLYAYRSFPIEFCEVASMSLELLGNQHLEVFLSPEEARRARRDHLEGIVALFPWVATVDAFQHWLYSHPRHSRDERRLAWLDLMNRFGGAVDWTRLGAVARTSLAPLQLHLFLHPFYYIEYGIAQLGRPTALGQFPEGFAGQPRPIPGPPWSSGRLRSRSPNSSRLPSIAPSISAQNRPTLVRLLETELAKLD